MKTLNSFKIFFLLLFCILIASLSSCASMYVRGSNPVQRAASAANLIIEGNTSDDYIKVYKTEIARADALILDMINRAERNDIYYADIADNISDWFLLYSRVLNLQRMYPEGLSGKKQFVVFEPRDYSELKEKSHIKATEALYNEAYSISKIYGSDPKKTSKILKYLKRAKKYSRHLDNEINLLAAETAYSTAESLSSTNTPSNLLEAAEYYTIADSWINGYKASLQKARNAKERAAFLYIEEGDYNMRLKDYTAFRDAKKSYQRSEKIIPSIASKKIAKVNRLLTITLAIILPENNYTYNQENRIRRAIESEIASANSGPANIEINFTRTRINDFFNFIDIGNPDLVFVPADNYGKVKEIYGPVVSSNKNVSKIINGITYTGIITEQTQTVTLYTQKDFVLYDIRSWQKKQLNYFNDETNKISKNFTARYYSGAAEARPADFNPGFLYKPGQYEIFFPELTQTNNSINLVTSYGSLTQKGEELCNEIKNLQYIEKQ